MRRILIVLVCVACGYCGSQSPTGPTPGPPPPGSPPSQPPAGPQTFVGAGDIAMCDVNSVATAALLDSIGGYVFTLGDNAYFRGAREEYRNCYDNTWGRHKGRTFPVPGNHEYMSAGALPYFTTVSHTKKARETLGDGPTLAVVQSFVPGAHAVATEDETSLRRVAEAFGADFAVDARAPDNVHVDHTTYLYAVDETGHVAITWPLGTTADDLADDIGQLLRERSD